MIKVGLSGNRFSGKKSTSKLFKQIGVPVFDADVVLKFIIHHNLSVIDELKKVLPDPKYWEDSYIKISEIKDAEIFDKIVNCAEWELMKAYENFNNKHISSLYTIFKSSILFERSWSEKMDYNISIFCPKKWRIDRHKQLTGIKYQEIDNFLSKELDDYRKNSMADFIIHNYWGQDPMNQVNEIDTKIIDSKFNLLKNKGNFKNNDIISNHY